jgi:hypothetical protein
VIIAVVLWLLSVFGFPPAENVKVGHLMNEYLKLIAVPLGSAVQVARGNGVPTRWLLPSLVIWCTGMARPRGCQLQSSSPVKACTGFSNG